MTLQTEAEKIDSRRARRREMWSGYLVYARVEDQRCASLGAGRDLAILITYKILRCEGRYNTYFGQSYRLEAKRSMHEVEGPCY